MNLLFITWDPNPVLISLGSFGIRWYSIFWMIALLTGSQVIYKLYKIKKLPINTFQTLFVYCFFGILIGARLGHCLFYDFDYFSNHPLEIFLPIRILADGSWKFTGYTGLASHGGTVGLIIALFLFCRKTKIHYLDILDMMGVAAPLSAGFIRLANLMNSEIIGKTTDVSWAFIFKQVDMQPRHPAQLYEAIAYFVIFVIIALIYKKKEKHYVKGYFFGLCITLIYLFRFFVEFFKERQVDFENFLPIDMGQILSIPFIIIGLYFILRKKDYSAQKA